VKYAYLLESEAYPDHFYTGITDDLRDRLARHNRGLVTHTAKFRPSRSKTYVGFTDEQKAFAFERYLMTASGRAFAKKRL
jgi:predicted GIY-YIG superfamily endonuclease